MIVALVDQLAQSSRPVVESLAHAGCAVLATPRMVEKRRPPAPAYDPVRQISIRKVLPAVALTFRSTEPPRSMLGAVAYPSMPPAATVETPVSFQPIPPG